MIKLYHNDMSVCAQKVRMTLAEKQLPWESHHLDLRERRSYYDAFDGWPNESYYALMKEKGVEAILSET